MNYTQVFLLAQLFTSQLHYMVNGLIGVIYDARQQYYLLSITDSR